MKESWVGEPVSWAWVSPKQPPLSCQAASDCFHIAAQGWEHSCLNILVS